MKRAIFVNIGVGLVLSLLLFSFQLSSIKATDTERTNISTTTDAPSSVALSTWKTLTNSEIKANWPNLPTAKEIWDTYWGKPPGVWYVNTAEASKAALDSIANYTSNEPDYLNGGISHNENHIWLQYNSTIWIQVPMFLVKTPTQPTPEPQPPSADSAALVSNWAIGLYANPSQIAGSTPVYGAVTFGGWGNYNPSANCFAGLVLTVCDGPAKFQVIMHQNTTGYYAVAQEWTSQGKVYDQAIRVYPTIGALYNQYIRYQTDPTKLGWEFYWNFQLIGPRVNDGCQTIISNVYQPNVVFESNDGDGTHFNNFQLNVGGIVDNQYRAAIGYLYGGNWVPLSLTDPVPSAYVYYGGVLLQGSFAVGYQAPPFSPFGERSSATETLTISRNIQPPPLHSQLW
jgi:hypothetical protein